MMQPKISPSNNYSLKYINKGYDRIVVCIIPIEGTKSSRQNNID